MYVLYYLLHVMTSKVIRMLMDTNDESALLEHKKVLLLSCLMVIIHYNSILCADDNARDFLKT